MNRRSRWPVRVKRGNSTVTIYKADRKKNGHMYREFKLAYYNEIGKRSLQSFNSFEKARTAADNVNVSLMKGEVKSLVLSNDDKVVYLRALKALKPTGTALDLTAHQFAELVKVLGGASPLEAARYYIRRHPTKLPRKTVQEVVEEPDQPIQRLLVNSRFRCPDAFQHFITQGGSPVPGDWPRNRPRTFRFPGGCDWRPPVPPA